MHHAGVPLMDGDKILKKDRLPWNEDKDDRALVEWIANEGARVSAIVGALNAASLEPFGKDLREVALGATPPNPIELARSTVPPSSPHASQGGVAVSKAGNVSFSVPLTITVSLGDPAAQAGAAATTPVDAAKTDIIPDTALPLVEKLVIDPDWSTRKGYDPDFLDISVPLPKLSAEMKANSVEDSAPSSVSPATSMCSPIIITLS